MGDRPNRVGFTVAVVAVAVSAGVGAGMLRRSPTQSPAVVSTVATRQPVEVHVAGWVLSPGVVTVPDGAIVADAIHAAGGLRAGASADSLNLAATVSDGDQLVVPGPDHGSSGESGPGDDFVSLNRATTSELEALPGVGPVLADRIVAFREEHGRFESVEDLLEVSGIGEAKLASIRDLVRP